MKNYYSLAAALMILLGAPSRAALPPAEQLLPADTLVLLSVPDWQKMHQLYLESPQAQLWEDPAIRPFKDKLMAKVSATLIAPIEKQLGINFSNYTGIAQGQVTFAITQNGWNGSFDTLPGILLLIDSGAKKDQVKKQLAELKTKWAGANQKMRTEKIRDVEFTTIVVSGKDVGKALNAALSSDSDEEEKDEDKDKEEAEAKPFELIIGQSDSLLIAGTSAKDIEKVLVRQSGGTLATLSEQAAYQANQSLFRDAAYLGWIHTKPLFDILSRTLTEAAKKAADEAGEENPLSPKPDRIFGALGLAEMRTVAFKVSGNREGTIGEFFAHVPAASRKGLFEIFAFESKDAAPPSFVPATAVQFYRWRIDAQKAWAGLETMLGSISPEISGVVQMSLAAIGKDKDPDFDLKKSLINNLGDDFMVVQKAPRSSTFQDLSSPPALYLLGSPNPEQLAQAFKTASSLLPTGGGAALKDREFLGRKVYSFPLPAAPAVDGTMAEKSLHFAASNGYVALSPDVAMLEEFLRSGDSNAKSLRETAGLADSAQKVGGMATGFSGFENQRETMRATVETLKNDSASIESMFAFLGQGEGNNLKDWVDFSSLPAFDKIAKYFSYVVYNGAVTPEGFIWKIYSPTPPELKK